MKNMLQLKTNDILSYPNLHYLNEFVFHIHSGGDAGEAYDIRLNCAVGCVIKTEGTYGFYVDNNSQKVYSYTFTDTNEHNIRAEDANYDIIITDKTKIGAIQNDRGSNKPVYFNFDIDDDALSYCTGLCKINIRNGIFFSGNIKKFPTTMQLFDFNQSPIKIDLTSIAQNQVNGLIRLSIYGITQGVGNLNDIKTLALVNNLYGTNSFQYCSWLTGDVETLAADLAASGRTSAFKAHCWGTGVTFPSGFSDYFIIRFGSQYPNGYQISNS